MRRLRNAVIGTVILAAIIAAFTLLPWIIGEQWWRIFDAPNEVRIAGSWFFGLMTIVAIGALGSAAHFFGNEIGDPVVTKIEKVVTERRQKKATPKEMQGAVSRTEER